MSHNYVIKRIISVVLSVCMVMSVALTALPNAATANAITKGVSLTDSEEAGYEVLTFSDFGIGDGEILTASSYGTHFISDTLSGDLDEVLFQGQFVFPSADTIKQFGNIYLGKAKYYGLVLCQDSVGNILLDVISSTTNKSVVENKDAGNLTAHSSVQLRGNSDLEIAISVKYENTTDTTTDLKIGVWINGTQTTGGYIYARAVALGDLTRCFHTTDYHTLSSVTVKSSSESETPESNLLSESEEANYEKLTFSDFGVADGAILTQGSGHVVSEVLEGDLNEVLFQGKYLFPTVEQAARFGNIYLGKANYYSIVLTQDSVGNVMLDVISSATNKSAVENPAAKNLTATNTVELRNNPDLEIAISIKYENTTDTTTDLKIGVWLNGVLSGGGYVYAKAIPLTDLTRCFHTTDVDTKTSVTVASVGKIEEPEEPVDVLLSESEEANYENLTFGTFGVADGEILTQGSGHVVSNVLEGDLNEILFQGKYLFPTIEQSLKFGNIYLGKANYYAIVITQDSAGNILLDVISSTTNKSVVENKAATNLTANSPVELRNNSDLEIAISVKYENTGSTTTDLKIGVWINGVLQKGGYIYARGVALGDLIRCFHTTDIDVNSSVTISSVGETQQPEPEEILLSDSEEANYENLTFGTFGIADGIILNQGSGHVVSGVLEGDLNEILFQGKYLFPTIEQAKKFGNIYLGKANYYAIVITQDSAGNILLDVISSTTNKSVVENKAATNLTANSPVELRNNSDLEIAISVKYENTGSTTTDLKIGVWINGVLQKGGYIYARGVALGDLIRCFHTTDIDTSSSVMVASVGEIVEPEKILLSESEEVNYEKLTFADFGAKDGEILTGKAGEKVTYATLPGTLDGILFQGKYVFPAMANAKQFGNIYLGRPDWWAIGFTQDSAGNILFTVVSDGSSVDNKNFCNLTVGNPLIQLRENENLEIAVSVKYENINEDLQTTDLKIGVWINGVLQQSDYIYARNVKLSDLTRCLHTYDAADGCGVTITSVGEWDVNTLPTDFTDITLSDGNIPDGNTVTYGKFTRIGNLNRTLFSANVQFNKVGSRLHLGNTGGGENVYSGMGLRLEKNGTLVLGNELASNETVEPNELASIGLNFFVLHPALAGMGDTFAGKEFLLQISTEFVDYDGGGEANDIKLGVFINGDLYCNNYVYIPNEAQTLATGVNFNGVNEADFARFSSVVLKELTTTDLGIKNGYYSSTVNGNSAAETLDQTAVTAYVTFGGTGSVAFGSNGKGVVYTYSGNNTVTVSHIKADNTVVNIGQVQIPANRATELRTTFQFIKAGDKTNLKIGVFVNGKLTNYKYFLVEDVDISVLTRSISVLPSGSTIRIGANNYEELTLRDFIVADKTRSDYGGRFTSYGEGTYNNTAFSAVLTFSDETQQKNGNCFYIGGKDWAGFRVELDANGRLGLSFVHADGVQMKLANINPEDVGMTSFQGKAFTYRVTFDVVESAQGQLDAIIGVYVNDVLCQGKYMTVKGVDPVALERGVFSYVDKNGGSLTMKSTNPVVDFTIFGLNRNWESTLGIQ